MKNDLGGERCKSVFEASQQVRYSNRPEVTVFDETFICDGHANVVIPGLLLFRSLYLLAIHGSLRLL